MNGYSFSDNIVRDSLELVCVKRTESDMESREEYNSNLVEIVKERISYDKVGGKVNLYAIPIRDVRIGENIYDTEGRFIAYRVD